MRRIVATALVSCARGLRLQSKLMATNTAAAADGSYQRHASKHRGSAVSPEAGRYHLHVALACPWADGALSMRAAASCSLHFASFA